MSHLMLDRARNTENGFVLPYVLVIIGILAIVTVITAERFKRQSDILSELLTHNDAEIALVSAEAASAFVILTSPPTDGGIHIFGETNDPLQSRSNLTLFEEQEGSSQDIWSVSQGVRLFNTGGGPVITTIQDGAGFIPLNSVVPELLGRFMKVLGFSEDESLNKVATLFDYMDTNHIRRFRGGERSDYRLRLISPPTNAPIRHYSELTRVLGWANDLNDENIKQIRNAVTLSPPIGYIKPIFMDPSLKTALAFDEPDNQRRNLSGALFEELSVDSYPSPVLRLTLIYPMHRGRALKRVIELERRATHLDKPFTRQQVYEEAVLGTQVTTLYEQMNDLEYVIRTTSDNSE